MRILIALHQFLPEFSAGTETLALRTAHHLQERGHAVAVLTGVAAEVPAVGDEVSCYEGLPVWRYVPSVAASVTERSWNLNRLIEKSYRSGDQRGLQAPLDWWRPDVVLVFHGRRLTLSFLELCDQRRLPTVVVLTDYWVGCVTGQLMLPDLQVCSGPDRYSANCARHLVVRHWPWLHRLPTWCWRLLAQRLPALQDRPERFRCALQRAGSVVVDSALMLERLVDQGFSQQHWQVIPHGIDSEPLKRLPPTEPWTPERGPLRIGFIGTLRPAKGAHVLLQALQHWQGPPLELAFYGSLADDPAYVRELEHRIASLPLLVAAQLRGTFPPDALYSTLRALDLLVIPSLWLENSPLILLQALAAHVPLVASAVDGMRAHIQDGITGVLVPPGDADELCAALALLAADPERLAAMQAAPRRIREVATYVDELEQVIDGVVR